MSRLASRPAAASIDLARRRLLAGMLLSGAALATMPKSARAAPAGFDMVDFDWLDTTRTRRVPARLYWPGQPATGNTTPLVVFSHGIGGSRNGYSYLGRHWASHGYASLHVQHVGSDRTLWAGNPFAVVGRLHAAAQEAEAMERARDVRFALDRMLGGDAPGGARSIDRRRIVAAGHSYGANTTLLVVGAQVERDGGLIALHDPRFTAAVLISAPPFYGEADAAAVLRQVRVPTLHVTATEDVIRIPGYYSGASDRVAVFEAVGDPRKTLVVFAGGSHSMFTDRAGTGGTTLNPQVKNATKELALAFFRATFDDHAADLSQWGERWRPIVAHVAGTALSGRAAVPAASGSAL
jgi:predicted dienelactone hydrolase